MAIEDLRQFLKALGDSEEAQIAIGLLVHDAPAFAEQAQAAGYAVREEDVRQLQHEAELLGEAELSEEALELVSGGALPTDRLANIFEIIIEGTKQGFSGATTFISNLPGNLVKGAHKDYHTIRGWLGG